MEHVQKSLNDSNKRKVLVPPLQYQYNFQYHFWRSLAVARYAPAGTSNDSCLVRTTYMIYVFYECGIFYWILKGLSNRTRSVSDFILDLVVGDMGQESVCTIQSN
jgi:hypothetical protein